MKERLLILLSLPIACLAFSCNKAKPVVETKVHEVTMPAFGNVNFEITHNEFVKAGFNYNDIVEVTFHNYDGSGRDISYEVAYVTNYNEVGYYCPCLCNYEGKGERFDIAFGMSPLKDHSSILVGKPVTITMKEKNGYAKIRNLVEVSKKLTYEELDEDNHAFANFRDVATVGYISDFINPRRLYRGSSPFNNKDNPDDRHHVADRLLGGYGIHTEISLSGTDEKIAAYMEQRKKDYKESPTVKLYETKYEEEMKNRKFYSEDLGTDYFTIRENNDVGKCGGDLCRGIFEYISVRCKDGDVPQPVYIHCNEGKDRTGFFVMILEALAEVPVNEIVNDFMATFKNYYNISRPNNRIVYDAIANLTIYRFIYSILIDNPVEQLPNVKWYEFNAKQEVERILGGNGVSIKKYAVNYLEKIIGLDHSHVEHIREWISNAN